jgi:Uma2 family endonuclease
MTVQNTIVEIKYPESDGQPMAETDLHRNWMNRIIDILQHRYESQQVYVSGNLLMYFVEGDPSKSVAPDALVVKGVDPRLRRTYKIWVEGKAPDVVFETTSESTRLNDIQKKFELYAQLGIREYFLYDPTADYLEPPLVGYRLGEAGYERIEPDMHGRLSSEELDLFIELDDGQLVFRDQATAEVQHTKAEAELVKRRLAEEQRRAAEEQRDAAENRARVLAEELSRLRAQLGAACPESGTRSN